MYTSGTEYLLSVRYMIHSGSNMRVFWICGRKHEHQNPCVMAVMNEFLEKAAIRYNIHSNKQF